MINKKAVKRIGKYIWEIPRSFRKDMRVPARFYCSDKMLDSAFEDKSLSQLVNTTTLPGIQKYALAMPDMHQGYGAPIGGVFATEFPEGIISPGAVGYDQNCLSPESRVLTENGTYIPIQDLEELWPERKVENIDLQRKDTITSAIIRFFKKHNNPIIYRVETISGNEIEATGDHPIQTKQGMKKVKNLEGNESVLVYPFKGVRFEHPPSKPILTRERFEKILEDFDKGKRGNAAVQITKFLEKRDLLPLDYDSETLPYLLRIMGFVFGDGVLTFINGKEGVVQFYAEKEDLKDIADHIGQLGLARPTLHSREREHSINTPYGKSEFEMVEHSIRVSSTSFALLLVALGVPWGKKTHKEYGVPDWIFECPLWQKRLFLASFFGAELLSPKALPNGYNFDALQLNMSKAEDLAENAKSFLRDIAKLLEEFGIETSSIQEVPGYKHEGKLGTTKGFRIRINAKSRNLVKFFRKISYGYNREKKKKACWAANYLKRKLRVVNLREKVREEVRKEYKRGEKLKEIVEEYSTKYTPAHFIRKSLWGRSRWNPGEKLGKPRIAFNFSSFEEYKKKNSDGARGLIWDRIKEVEEIPYSGPVYDFTVNHPSHNFIANNFVVSNCGVRLLESEFEEGEVEEKVRELAKAMQENVPSGLGRGRKKKFSISQIEKIIEGGVPYLVSQGYGEKEDILNCEEGGKMPAADADTVSHKAKTRGRDQVGTLGSGNHFLEIQVVDEIFDKQTARAFGLEKGQVTVMIHTGSRGFGHQNCTDYLKVARKAMNKYNISVPDRQLACMPFASGEGKRFFKALSCACNYAWANRHAITHYVRRAWAQVFGKKVDLSLIYDVAHNIAKVEEYKIRGEKKKVCVHRKGATRSFPPGNPELPENYRKTGQPVLIPGSMGSSSYVLVGTKGSEEAFYSTCHGAGRTMSRTAAKRKVSGQKLIKGLKKKGILVKCYSMSGVAEEAPLAYKNVDNVVEVVQGAGLAKKVVRLRPLAVIKGE